MGDTSGTRCATPRGMLPWADGINVDWGDSQTFFEGVPVTTIYPIVAYTLGALALFAVAMAVLLLGALSFPRSRAWLHASLAGESNYPILLAWIVALIAMSGSLFFSAGVGFVPCHLCWYQRIMMYPLVFVLGAGVLRADPSVWKFAIPLPVIGFGISVYHAVIQLRPSIQVTQCDAAAPCSARYVAVFGFISIPVMAGAAFLLITALLLTVRSLQNAEDTD
jgi:disulfide bond formation protein DsbB